MSSQGLSSVCLQGKSESSVVTSFPCKDSSAIGLGLHPYELI